MPRDEREKRAQAFIDLVGLRASRTAIRRSSPAA
jgi:hypothetical protein